MEYKKLYIIGNGFDVHHCIKSSYRNYMNWLKEYHKEDYQKIVNFYGEEAENLEWWYEFETNLGYFDIRGKVESLAFQNQPTDSQIEKMLDIDTMGGAWDAQVEIGGIIKILKSTFHDWIDSLSPALSGSKTVLDATDSFFINFNYSLTLENVYSIPSNQIFHIHGCLNDDEYIIGHGRSYEDVKEDAEPYLAPFDPDKDDPSEYGLYAIDDEITDNTKREVITQVMDAAKPTSEIISNNSAIFEQLKYVTEVYIYGLSFSPVDEPYLEHIISTVAPNAQYVASYYSRSDMENIETFAKKHDIAIRLVQLEDLQVVRQLKMFE